jgi:hypothetical protein
MKVQMIVNFPSYLKKDQIGFRKGNQRMPRSKRYRIVPLLLLFLVGVGCDLETSVDYDHAADFSGIQTYAWSGEQPAEVNDLVHKRIINAIDDQLRIKGLTQVESDPDVYIIYHGGRSEKVVVDTTHHGYRYGTGWRWRRYGGTGTSTSTVRRYKEGTLIVDIYKAAEKELIWRGTVTGTVENDPDEKEKKINKGVAKLFEKYPPPTEKG